MTEGTTCVDDLASPAYNTIASRADIGGKVHGENMWRVPEYARGLLVDYPTNRQARAGSCIFIHLRLPGAYRHQWLRRAAGAAARSGAGFLARGRGAAILPRQALSRFKGCLP